MSVNRNVTNLSACKKLTHWAIHISDHPYSKFKELVNVYGTEQQPFASSRDSLKKEQVF
jgi:hypothetical protein